MNSKNISKSLTAKLNNWLEHIEDQNVRNIIKSEAMVTGGALVSLLNNETPNDYDIYFKSFDAAVIVAQYYANIWNNEHPNGRKVEITTARTTHELGLLESENKPLLPTDYRVMCHIQSAGMVAEEGENGIDDLSEPYSTENEEDPTQPNPEIQKPKYRPRYFSTNAISLSDGIQLVIRFHGPIEEIHRNYDFEHTKCSFDYFTRTVELPQRALECIINKELHYSGSRYPLASIIRTRKFIQRGWSINAGQYVKMVLQLQELNLKDLAVFKDQLVGVDSAYFNAVIAYIAERQVREPHWSFDNSYIISIIDKIF